MDLPQNIDKEPIKVKHAELERTGDSSFVSVCPVCKEGVLLVQRDRETFKIISEDRCILCGQAFVYEDLPNQ